MIKNHQFATAPYFVKLLNKNKVYMYIINNNFFN